MYYISLHEYMALWGQPEHVHAQHAALVAQAHTARRSIKFHNTSSFTQSHTVIGICKQLALRGQLSHMQLPRLDLK